MSGSQILSLPASTGIAQPGSGYYNLYNALWMLNNNAASTSTQQQLQQLSVTVDQIGQQMFNVNVPNITTLQSQMATVQSQIIDLQAGYGNIQTVLTSLQSQIDSILQRMANYGIP